MAVLPSGGLPTEDTSLVVAQTIAAQRMTSVFKGLLDNDHSRDTNKRNLKAVLAAVSEVIRGQSENAAAQPGPTQYFAALMTVLESADLDHMHLLVHLLSITMPAVPAAVLRAKATAVESVFDGLWQICVRTAQSNNEATAGRANALTRALLQCQSPFLVAQDASSATWQRPSLLKVFHSMLSSVADPRAKLRRIAQDGIVALLERHAAVGSPAAATLVQQFCIGAADQRNVVENATSLMRALALMRRALGLLPAPVAARVALALLNIPQGNTRLSIECVRTVDALLSDTRCALRAEELKSLGERVLDLKPSDADAEPAVAYAQVVADAQVRFTQCSPELGATMLPRSLLALSDNLGSSHRRVRVATGKALAAIVDKCFDLELLAPIVAAQQAAASEGRKPLPAERALATLRSFIGLRYAAATDAVVPVARQLLVRLGEKQFEGTRCAEVVGAPFVAALAELHQQQLILKMKNGAAGNASAASSEDVADDSSSSTHSSPVELALAAGLCLLGVEGLLKIVPVQEPLQASTSALAANMPRGVARDRRWMLTFLKQHLSRSGAKTSLTFFQSQILGLARQCEALARQPSLPEAMKRRHRDASVRLWCLFPGFCTNATDVAAAFSSLGPMLGAAIKDERYPQLAVAVSQGLKTLVTKAILAAPVKGVAGAAAEGDAKDKQTLARYAKNFLPLLFNAYDKAHGEWSATDASSPPAGIGRGGNSERTAAILLTIGAYCSITPDSLLDSIFDQLLQKLLRTSTETAEEDAAATVVEGGESEAVRSTAELQRRRRAIILTGIASSAAPHVSVEKAGLLFRALQVSIRDDTRPLLQKRSYACLEALCKRPNLEPEMLAQLSAVLQDSLVACTATAKKHRLRCLTFLVGCGGLALGERKSVQLLSRLMGELLLCTKDTSLKVREVAFELLTSIARSLSASASAPDAPTDAVQPKEFVQMAMAALGGKTPHMRSAALLGLTRLMYELREELFDDMGGQLLDLALILMREKAKEVVKSSLGYLKMSITVMKKEELLLKLKPIMAALMLWAGESKNRFKQKIRLVLERLVRKLGVEAVRPLVPARDAKLLTHILRSQERQRKKKVDARAELRRQRQAERKGAKGALAAAVRPFGPGGKNARSGSMDVDMNEDSDDYDGMSDDDASLDGEKERSENRKSHKRGQDQSDGRAAAQWLRKDGEGGAMDLLNAREVSVGMRKGSNPNTRRGGCRGEESDGEDDEVTMGRDGRIVIKERASAGKIKSKNKRARDDAFAANDDVDSDDEAVGHFSSAGKSTKRGFGGDLKKKGIRQKKTLSRKRDPHSGVAYKSGKAGGDKKRKGKVDPYAYIPLDVKYLGKKHKKESLSRFAGVTHGGKKKTHAAQPNRKQKKRRRM